MEYKFECSECGGNEALLVKLQSIPFLLEIKDGPAFDIDLPRERTEVIDQYNFTSHKMVCGGCGALVVDIPDPAAFTSQDLLNLNQIKAVIIT